ASASTRRRPSGSSVLWAATRAKSGSAAQAASAPMPTRTSASRIAALRAAARLALGLGAHRLAGLGQPRVDLPAQLGERFGRDALVGDHAGDELVGAPGQESRDEVAHVGPPRALLGHR